MAKQVKKVVKLQLDAGKATPAGKIGTVLGPTGINLMGFTKEFNDKTANQAGTVVPVEITIFDDRSFTFITKVSPVAELIKKTLGIKSGSSEPNKEKVGKLTKEQVQAIAEQKMPDLNAANIDSAMRIVEGTARSMGITTES